MGPRGHGICPIARSRPRRCRPGIPLCSNESRVGLAVERHLGGCGAAVGSFSTLSLIYASHDMMMIAFCERSDCFQTVIDCMQKDIQSRLGNALAQVNG